MPTTHTNTRHSFHKRLLHTDSCQQVLQVRLHSSGHKLQPCSRVLALQQRKPLGQAQLQQGCSGKAEQLLPRGATHMIPHNLHKSGSQGAGGSGHRVRVGEGTGGSGHRAGMSTGTAWALQH